MTSAKSLQLRLITSSSAIPFVKKWHYSNSVVNNSQIHFGVFLGKILHGVMSFGPSFDKSKLLPLVKGAEWNEMLELNRMAFDPFLPRNSESRAIAVALRLLKTEYPQLKFIVSFADAQQCGDGTIYRASGFKLTGYSAGRMWKLPQDLAILNGHPIAHDLKLRDKSSKISRYLFNKNLGKSPQLTWCIKTFGGEILTGYNFRYIYFYAPEVEANYIGEVYPYSLIDDLDAGMYRGQSRARRDESVPSPVQGEEGSASLTRALH